MHGQWDKPRFRKLLAGAMEAYGLSQREVADLAGVSHSQVSRWMSGAHRPDYENTRQLGAALAERGRDLTIPLLFAAGYDASGADIALELAESVGIGESDGPPHFDDPAEQRVADQVWADNARYADDPEIRLGFVGLAVRMYRKRIADEARERRVRRA